MKKFIHKYKVFTITFITILLISAACLIAAIPMYGDDPSALVSRKEVIDYFESMEIREATRDKATLIHIYDVLESVLETIKKK